MCPGACSRVLGAALCPLAVLCAICNVLLFFPNWETQFVHGGGAHLTPEVMYMGGLVGGGLLIVITAIHFQAAGHRGCCGNRCGMFLSMLMAVLGIGGAIYAMTVSGLALVRGPLCQYLLPEGNLSDWGRPFQGPPWKSDDDDDFRKSSYLFHPELWGKCHNPPDVVKFNIILFSLILGGAVLELLLCTVQFFNSCAGCICGPRLRKRPATQH
ncbi:transmembrane 4 L6 family member 5-like [Alligator mississippiensis]|uniref:Transmembrane 4 L6 family member 5-like n=1 Tax=Alligator mississippiensis TaxID=8496 RepID=A0A151MCK6_ALLMI|nr:transmembrane 4 L6 family member 5-like [Alligator mississippiensis]